MENNKQKIFISIKNIKCCSKYNKEGLKEDVSDRKCKCRKSYTK